MDAAVFKIIVALIFTFPIFSYLFSLRYKNRGYSIKKYAVNRKIKIIDPTYINSALWVVCMIYILYICTLLGYFFSEFRKIVTGGFTYAE